MIMAVNSAPATAPTTLATIRVCGEIEFLLAEEGMLLMPAVWLAELVGIAVELSPTIRDVKFEDVSVLKTTVVRCIKSSEIGLEKSVDTIS